MVTVIVRSGSGMTVGDMIGMTVGDMSSIVATGCIATGIDESDTGIVTGITVGGGPAFASKMKMATYIADITKQFCFSLPFFA